VPVAGVEDRSLSLQGRQSRCAAGQWLSASVAISIIQGICFAGTAGGSRILVCHVCVYYCRTYAKAVSGGGEREKGIPVSRGISAEVAGHGGVYCEPDTERNTKKHPEIVLPPRKKLFYKAVLQATEDGSSLGG